MKVKLENVLEAIELANDAYQYYLNIETGETVMRADALITGIVDEKLDEELEMNYDKYFKLPTKYEINEYQIMEEFIWSLPDGNKQDKLENAIRGKGAFRRFKDTVYNMDIEKQWFAFEADAYKKIAIEWCERHDLQYEE